jgi:hypothetical protein
MDLERVDRVPRMDLERIEQALREGPPDEPHYVPGSYHRGRYAWPFATASVLVALTLIAVLAMRVGGDFRDGVGGPATSALVADIQGVWRTDPIEFRSWTDALLRRGFRQSEINAFLDHDPFAEQVRYQLRFLGDRLIIQATYDDLPLATLSTGTFSIDGGVLRFTESVQGVPSRVCRPTAAPTIVENRLTLRVVDLVGCGTDARIAYTLFLDLWPLTRAET